MTEEWKDIEGYENLYQVSNMGRVKSLDRLVKASRGGFRGVKGQLMSLCKDKDGYLILRLAKNGKHKNYKVHRLVAQAFIPNPENKPCIDHINGIVSDNRLENLRWTTHKENNNNPITYQRLKDNAVHRYRTDNPKSRAIIQFDLDGNLIRKWDCIIDAVKATNNTGVKQCCMGKSQTCGGSKWEYYNTDRYLIALMNKTIKDREKKRVA